MKNTISILFLTVLIGLFLSPECRSMDLALDKIKLPPGFRISIFAENIPNARSMIMSPNGILYVGTRKEGKVYAIIDKNQDYRSDEVITIARGLNRPNGVAIKDGDLYVAEIHRIIKFRDIDKHLPSATKAEIVYDRFPGKRWHGWKFIRFGPDDMLYVPLGAPCNVCEKKDPRYATIMRMKKDGSNMEIFAKGIRNTVGFDWHPDTRELWFTDNGRDFLGDDIPPDELNHAPEKGLHFGFPYYHGDNIPDPKYGKKPIQGKYKIPSQKLGPHVASLGMRFYTGNMFPEKYKNQIFIAEHGSWNRSVPIGYRITLVNLKNDKPLGYEVFASGWLQGDSVMGRPVDIEIALDGSLLVSDDYAGIIYRISYEYDRETK